MTKIKQEGYRRQRVVREVYAGRRIANVARRHGISRASVYRWLKRYDGTVESLIERSHRPHSHPKQQSREEYKLIRRAWGRHKALGLICFHMILVDNYGYVRSVSCLYRAMRKLGIGRKRQSKKRHEARPYETPKIPGERVQVDVKYVPTECLAPGAPKMYQYTAVDESTRLRCRMIFEEHSSWTSMKFIHYARKRFPFPIQCVQTDNGPEFTNALLGKDKLSCFERYLVSNKIRYKRIRVATPRHNGKVERVHRIDQERFYEGRLFYSCKDANQQLMRYQRQDNNFPLLVLGRKSPVQYWREIAANVSHII